MYTLLLVASCLVWASNAEKGEVRSKEVLELRSEDSTKEGDKDSKELERDSRGLLKKFGFLAGLKAGGGGLVSSSGTLAASNSLRVFGKVMNTALSVSYGHLDGLDDLPEVLSDSSGENSVKTEKGKVSTARQGFINKHNAHVSRLNHKFLRSEPESVFPHH